MIKISFYKCDSKFYLDDVLEMYKEHDSYGIIYTDGKICIYYELKDKYFKKINTIDIYLQNQFRNGGQSSNRLSRNRDINRNHYLTELAEDTIEIFYDKNNNISKVKYLIFCGSAQFKKELSEHKLITGLFTSVYTLNMEELNYDLILKSINDFDSNSPNEKRIVEKIKFMIEMADDKLVFGIDDILEHIRTCEIKTIYISQNLDELIRDIESMRTYEFEIIKLKSNMINDFGGIIGEKFY
jgi:peptide subunit release factor 1 (eRF1)